MASGKALDISLKVERQLGFVSPATWVRSVHGLGGFSLPRVATNPAVIGALYVNYTVTSVGTAAVGASYGAALFAATLVGSSAEAFVAVTNRKYTGVQCR